MTGSVESRLPHLEPLETALGEPVSPELVLVDRALAERARSRLPSPDDTLARLAALVLTSRMASLTQPTADVPVRGFPPHEIEATRRARIRQRRVAALAGGVTAVTLVIASLVGVRVDVRGEPAGADIAPSGDAPVASVPQTPSTGAKTKSSIPRAPRPTKPEPQRFAWAPASGATGYHVELFRGSDKVFEADTELPAITVPATWTLARRRHALEPAVYRWYVWPVASGRRAARATVQAKLVIPAR